MKSAESQAVQEVAEVVKDDRVVMKYQRGAWFELRLERQHVLEKGYDASRMLRAKVDEPWWKKYNNLAWLGEGYVREGLRGRQFVHKWDVSLRGL